MTYKTLCWCCKVYSYAYDAVRMAVITKAGHAKCWQGCGGRGTFIHCCWKRKLDSRYGIEHEGSSKVNNKVLM